MLTVPVMTQKGIYRMIRTRVPRTGSFNLYRKAEEEALELLKQIYAVIARDVEARSTETVHISTDLIDRVPADWPFRPQWLKFSGSEPEMRSLFEQVLWTYFFDVRNETWETSWPTKDQPFSEYVRQVVTPTEAEPPSPGPDLEAETDSVNFSSGIEMASTARATAVPAAVSPTDQLSIGDIVEIIKGRYKGLKGEVTKIEMIDGFDSVTVKLPGDDEYYEVPNFPTSALRKL
jgi:hypothetical protein